jgi:histidyl-tRNA synthetase
VTSFEAPRGTHDILPSDQPLWRRVLGEAERLCAIRGYRRIDTPTFEDTTLFTRTSGVGSDIVQKEMYTFEDRGGRSLTLRPEATAPICRAYVEHGLHRQPQPVKLYTVAPMYRYASPQRGRFREHWQLSVEAIGSNDPALDAELIELYDALLGALGVREYQLDLNSIGDADCRPAYLEELGAWLSQHQSELDEDTRAKARASPLRVFDNLEQKPPNVQEALESAPKVGESLCEQCRDHFAAVCRFLDAYGVRYRLKPTLVRGLDYYTRTTWEFMGPERGAQSAISGGGRYDGLVGEIGGPPTPGVGFGAGIERLLIALEHAGVSAEVEPIDVFFIVGEDADRRAVLAEMKKVRDSGLSAETDYVGRSLKGQTTQANRLRSNWWVRVIGDSVDIRRRGEDDLTETIAVHDIAEFILRRSDR